MHVAPGWQVNQRSLMPSSEFCVASSHHSIYLFRIILSLGMSECRCHAEHLWDSLLMASLFESAGILHKYALSSAPCVSEFRLTSPRAGLWPGQKMYGHLISVCM